MKKLWNRFRKWLIKKLGGYVAGPAPITVRTCNQRSVKLWAMMSEVPRNMYTRDPAFKYSIHKALCAQFMDEILEHHQDVIHIECAPEIDAFGEPFDTLKVRAYMNVLERPGEIK